MDRGQVEEALRRMGIQPLGFSGNWIQAKCPFASTRHARGTDKKPSFGVSTGPSSGYYCLSCHAKGRFTDLPKDLHSITGQAYEELTRDLIVAEATGVVVQAKTYETYEEIEPLSPDVYGDLFLSLCNDARDYANSRDVDPETLEAIGVRDWPEETYLMFPVKDFRGNLYGWTGRNYNPEADKRSKVWNTKGLDKSCHLLGAELCSCDRPIVGVEGLMFYSRLHDMDIQGECGADPVAFMGSAVSFEQADLLAQIGHPVILFLDNDKAGKLGTWGEEKLNKKTGVVEKKDGAVHLLSRGVPVKVVEYPPGIEDPDDLTDDQIYDMIDNAKDYVRKRKRGG